MPKFMRAALVFTVLLIAGSVYVISFALPDAIEQEAKNLLTTAGFPNAALPQPQRHFGQVTYSDIQLDKDGFSTIARLELEYSIFGLHSIYVDAPDLTGELLDDLTIRIAGHEATPQKHLDFKALKAAKVSIKNARIALLSKEFGGINLNFDLQLRPHNQKIQFQAALTGKQKQLSFKANMNGDITKEGLWQNTIEIEQGKFALGAIQAARLAGIVNMNGDFSDEQAFTDTHLLGELQAGGMNIIGLPWQNAALTLDGTLGQTRMIIAAKSAGYEGIELGLTMDNLQNQMAFSGNLHTDRLGPLLDYLQSQNALPITRSALASLDAIPMLDLEFQMLRDELIFNIKRKNQSLDIKGSIDNFMEPEIHGRFISEPIMLHEIGAFEAEGQIALDGRFIYTAQKPLQGEIAAKINKLTLNYGNLKLKDLQGTLQIDDLAALSSKSAEFKGNLASPKLQHQAHLKLQLNKGAPLISDFKLDIAGLALHSEKPSDFDVTSLDLQDLFKALKLENWVGTGRLSGAFQLSGSNTIKKLRLHSIESGILKIKDPEFLSLIPGDEAERETIRQALENFHYDALEITGHGQFPDGMEFRLVGKGRNPGLMNGQAFAIDLAIKPDLTPLFARFFKD